MFGTIGGPELFLILVIALIVFGPRKLPEIGRTLGKAIQEFRHASTEFRHTLEEEVDAEKRRETDPARLPYGAVPSGAVSPEVAPSPPPDQATPPSAAPPEGLAALPSPPIEPK